MDLKELVAAYHSIYEGKEDISEDEKYGYDKDGNSLNPKDKDKKKKKDKTKNKDEKWQDSDGDGKWYEEGEDVKKEAIEFAADYFLEEGIEEEELDVIIEDVGLDDFVEFVNEERAARKARASAPSYKKVKAAVDASDAAKKKAGKGEYSAAYKKKETDVTVYDDKPAKASVKKVKKAVAKTKAAKPAAKKAAPAKKAPAKKAPEKKAGLISKIGSAYKKGVERHKAARAKGKVPEKRVKEFGKGFASGVKDTVKFAGKVKKAVVGETLLALLDTLEEGADLDIYDTVVAYLIDEKLAEDFDSATKIMGTLKPELIDEVYVQQVKCLVESEKVAQGAQKRAEQLASKRRQRGYREKGYNAYRPGKNERAGYNLARSARSSDASPETQRTKKKQPAGTDTSQIGHYKKRDEKQTVGKRGKPLKQPRYKLSLGQRVDHHSNKALNRRDPKQNPKHTANIKKEQVSVTDTINQILESNSK